MSRRRSFRSLIVVALLGPLLAVVGADPAAAEIRDADACDLDHGLAGTGRAIIQVSRDGWTLDRFVLDHEGRVVTIERRFNENEVGQTVSVSDRISRFLPNGALDTTFGQGGTVELPGVAFSGWTRNVAIGPSGEIWTMRATFTNVLEYRRFLPDGTPDPNVDGVTYTSAVNFEADPVGALNVRADGVAEALVAGNAADYDGTNNTSPVTWSRTEIRPNGGIGSYGFGARFIQFGFGHSYQIGEGPGQLAYGTGRLITNADTGGGSGYLMAAGWYHRRADHTYVMARADRQESMYAVGGQTTPDVDANTIMGSYRLAFDGTADVLHERVLDLGTNDIAVAMTTDRVFSMDEDRNLHVTTYDFENDVLGDTITIPNVGPGGAIWPSMVQENSDGTWSFVTWTVPAPVNQPLDKLVYVRSAPAGIDVPDGGELGDQITRLFQAYFQRQPGDEGLDFWRTRRANGQTLDSISDSFAASPEFIDTYGDLDNGEFVDLVYANVLGRAADAGGRANWVGHLDAGRLTRGRVMTGFSESAEFRGNTGTTEAHDGDEGQVHRLYNAYFGRDADRNGFCYWVRQLATGHLGLDRISQAFANSAEFQATYGELDDGEFVDLVYDNVLGRPADPDGREFWVGQLENGNRTRGQLMIGVSESLEYLLATDTLPS